MREDILSQTELEIMQYELEEEAVESGRKRYEEYLDLHDKHQNHDSTVPSLQMIRHLVDQVAEAIEEDRKPRRGAGRGRRAVKLCGELPSVALGYITLRHALSSGSRETTWTVAANRVGQAILEELRMAAFAKVDQKKYELTQTRLRENRRKKARAMISQAHSVMADAGIEMESWCAEDRIHVGTWLLDLLCRSTGLFVDQTVTQSRKKMQRLFLPTDALTEWLSGAHETLAVLCPIRMPMVVKPLPWSSPFGGGYLTDQGGAIDLVKTSNEGYLGALEQVHMPEVYDSVNALQDTAWRVNTGVLRVAQELWKLGETVGKPGKESLLSRDPVDVPPIPAQWEGKVPEWRKADPAGYSTWARTAAATHQDNGRLRSKRISCGEALAVAERMSPRAAIYYPYQLDFRGRAYPVSAHLTPQGSDLSKGILQFAEGKALGATGAYWLKVHIANTFGVDKCAFADRVKWVDDHRDVLLDSAFDPIDGELFWRTADSPFQALAAVFEYAGFILNGADHVSHLPVGMDGSCNGLQNFSAMLRDPVGGAATNLVPNSKPADIYTQVAEVVKRKVAQDAEGGGEYQHAAMRWDGFIDRALVKQPVMTMPYGATSRGMRKQIEVAVIKGGNRQGIATNEMWETCGYLGNVVDGAIKEVVIAAAAAMNWLQDTARLVASDDLPIRWTTPVGLPVLQEYKRYKGKQIKVHIGGKQQKVSVAKDSIELDKKRQAAGISPNLIHSFDAAHMMKTVLLCMDNGLSSFGMVHDSYAVHAADIDIMHAAIRESFVDMYASPLLEDFRDQVASQVPDAVSAQFPELPPCGGLDLEVIKDSLYFFA